jgi:hypothetical protein
MNPIEQAMATQPGYDAVSPENIPEVLREVTMIRGALSGVEHRWEELVIQLRPVRQQRPEMVSPDSPQDSFAVYSPLAKDLREIYAEVSRIEDWIVSLIGELGL